MKKITAIFLTCFYLFASVGVAVNVHYCGGELESVELVTKTAKCCCGDAEVLSMCCDDETFYVQLDKEDKLSSGFSYSFEQLQAIVSHSPTIENPIFLKNNELDLNQKNRPPPVKEPFWLLYSNLTFYG
jgi:hypothetical protein